MKKTGKNKVVVAVDEGNDLESITTFTIDLLKDWTADVYVVQFSDDPAITPFISKQDAKNQEGSLAENHPINSILKKLKRNKIKAEGFVGKAEGSISKSIVKFAGENDAELLIVDSHDTRPLERIMHGSLAEKVIRDSPIPVAVVPRECP